MMPTEDDFQFDVQILEKVAHLDLSRPAEGNRLTREMMGTLARTIRGLGEREDVNVIALRARGEAFCRGRDGRQESMAGLSPYQVRQKMMAPVLAVYTALSESPIPVVACVHAAAIGFGAALVGGCDIALASTEAAFAFPEINHNIAPTMAMSAIIRKLPPAVVSYLIYSGEQISAADALRCGLVGKLYPPAKFDAESGAFLDRLASRPRPILETIKKYQMGAAGAPATLSADYAGALLALVRGEGSRPA